MLNCQIVGLTQDMDFTKNVTQTFLVLELSNGLRVRAAVDDATTQIVVNLQVGVHSALQPADDATEFTDVAEGVHVFGEAAEGLEDYAEPVEVDDEDLPVMADPDAVPEPVSKKKKDQSPLRTARNAVGQAQPARDRRNVFRTPEGKIIVPQKKVAGGLGGYPMVPQNGVSIDDIASNTSHDEDGVDSV